MTDELGICQQISWTKCSSCLDGILRLEENPARDGRFHQMVVMRLTSCVCRCLIGGTLFEDRLAKLMLKVASSRQSLGTEPAAKVIRE